MIELVRHRYKYFPYELELAKREALTLLAGDAIAETADGIHVSGTLTPDAADRLVYFAGAREGGRQLATMQSRLERVNGNGPNRQSTRYSAHGLHEYKGKFNPQIVRAMLNILDIPGGATVLDPFCGSGTSLVECGHLGMNALGADINPMAVFIANAKIGALRTPASVLRQASDTAVKQWRTARRSLLGRDAQRDQYLLSWFDPEVFDQIERLRQVLGAPDEPVRAVLLALASNLLRDYSLQDPNDLRIRRRKTPLPEVALIDAYAQAAAAFIDKLEDTQRIVPAPSERLRAILADSRGLADALRDSPVRFDCALTSPPYATALPYIDTQRLSLVWLGLVPPDEILPLEARLVGSRETRGARSKRALQEALVSNANGLPAAEAAYCRRLLDALGAGDGFRRQAVPALLYRYFAAMAEVFRSVRPLMKAQAPFALIVGGNHTVLGGERFDIDTPAHLASLAQANGWRHVETIPLQTYQRFGYHQDNAVTVESMVIVRAR
jgi:site-specific DNA-methyltransferase (cytosine-N4-specific)